MKNFFLTFLVLLFAKAIIAQDAIYTVNNWGGTTYDGVTAYSIDPASGNVSSSTTYASTPFTTFQSTALGINSSGYLYSIPKATNTGEFNVYSMLASGTTAPTTPLLTADINGAGNNAQVEFRRLGIRDDGWAYMISMEAGSGTIYFSRFLTDATGGASNFQNLGTMILSDGAATNFFNGDLAFDGNGDMIVLVNADQAGGVTKIYKATAATVAAATGSSSVTMLTYRATVLTPSGTNFSGTVTGLAFASNGNLYLSSQDASKGLYLISKDPSGTILATATNYTANPGIGDIASSYYPTATILPVTYRGAINARILSGELQVTWATSSEKNNSRFDIEASKDGKNFVKIGTLNSKATNGMSSNDLDYQFSTPLNNVSGVLGFSVFALALIGLPAVKRRNRIILSFAMLAGVIMFAASCSKRQDQIDTDNNNKIFVRLVQYDIDGKQDVSKVITAYKAD